MCNNYTALDPRKIKKNRTEIKQFSYLIFLGNLKVENISIRHSLSNAIFVNIVI